MVILRYKTHIVSSLSFGAGFSILFQYPFHIGYVLGVSFGSLLPNIDEPNSFIGRRSFGIAKRIKGKYGHRGITHSFFCMVFTFIFLSFIFFSLCNWSFHWLLFSFIWRSFFSPEHFNFCSI